MCEKQRECNRLRTGRGQPRHLRSPIWLNRCARSQVSFLHATAAMSLRAATPYAATCNVGEKSRIAANEVPSNLSRGFFVLRVTAHATLLRAETASGGSPAFGTQRGFEAFHTHASHNPTLRLGPHSGSSVCPRRARVARGRRRPAPRASPPRPPTKSPSTARPTRQPTWRATPSSPARS